MNNLDTTYDSLDDLLVDEDVYTEGRWVQPDPDRPLKIKTKGYPDAYTNASASMQREAAKGFNYDTDRLKATHRRNINVKCLIKHSLVDVKGCTIGGRDLSFEEFCALIQEKRGQKLLGLAFMAANMATEAQKEEDEVAEGN
ncbi:hypothetical protein J2847_002965 [Azospirillum agricola]|uniref:hypothetical protein n=1 Tax=Azospirillum agricola TaxID=1720247 RepID=UPI001AE818D7|nr:hypothetical protein [Azospirillum agricola]MBP2229666.1 hypothetical protein [Azospirillum agricola]